MAAPGERKSGENGFQQALSGLMEPPTPFSGETLPLPLLITTEALLPLFAFVPKLTKLPKTVSSGPKLPPHVPQWYSQRSPQIIIQMGPPAALPAALANCTATCERRRDEVFVWRSQRGRKIL